MTGDEMVGWYHNSVNMSLSELQGDGKGQGCQVAAVHGVTNSRAQFSD